MFYISAERFSILFLPLCSIIARTRSECKLQWIESVNTFSAFSQIQCKLFFRAPKKGLFTLCLILQPAGLIWKVSHHVPWVTAQSHQPIRGQYWAEPTNQRPGNCPGDFLLFTDDAFTSIEKMIIEEKCEKGTKLFIWFILGKNLFYRPIIPRTWKCLFQCLCKDKDNWDDVMLNICLLNVWCLLKVRLETLL